MRDDDCQRKRGCTCTRHAGRERQALLAGDQQWHHGGKRQEPGQDAITVRSDGEAEQAPRPGRRPRALRNAKDGEALRTSSDRLNGQGGKQDHCETECGTDSGKARATIPRPSQPSTHRSSERHQGSCHQQCGRECPDEPQQQAESDDLSGHGPSPPSCRDRHRAVEGDIERRDGEESEHPADHEGHRAECRHRTKVTARD